jgi:hypothetical protein
MSPTARPSFRRLENGFQRDFMTRGERSADSARDRPAPADTAVASACP